MEYPYSFKSLVPEAYNKYVVTNLRASEQFFFLDFLGALRKYSDSESLYSRNLVVQSLREGKNIVPDYLKLTGVKEYAYDQKGIPKDYLDNMSEDIDDSDASVIVTSPDSFDPYTFGNLRSVIDFDFRWHIRRSALGYFKDKFSKYDHYVLGVDVSCFNTSTSDAVFSQIDKAVCANVNSRILLANTWNCEHMDMLLDRYRDRVHFRTCSNVDDPLYRCCVDLSMMYMCDACLVCDSSFSSFSRVYNSGDMTYYYVDNDPCFEELLINEEE